MLNVPVNKLSVMFISEVNKMVVVCFKFGKKRGGGGTVLEVKAKNLAGDVMCS